MAVEAAYRLLHTVEPIFGAFFDATASIEFYLKFLDREFDRERVKRGVSVEDGIDAFHPSIAYGVDRGGEKPDFVHAVPFFKFKRRNAKNGPTTILLGNSIAIQICALWEHRFRQEIADEFGIDKKQLMVPLFGDLRLLRNAIVHASGKLETPVSRLEVMKWVDQETIVEFDEGKIIWLSEQIEEFAHTAAQYRPAV